MNKPHLRYRTQTPRERTWTIHFISIEKVIKGVILVAIAFKLLSLFNRDVHAWAEDFVTQHGIDSGNRFVHSMLDKLVGFNNNRILAFSAVAFVYSALLFTEGLGLWFQKRWAEYLTAIGTALLIPVELFEIYERFTWVRLSILILNIFIVWYLVTRLKDEKKVSGETESIAAKTDRTRVKICGITNINDALLAIEFGADELGFNFYEKSPRFVTPEQARAMIATLPDKTVKIGVFVNAALEQICETAKIAGLDVVQLHGDEEDEFIEDLHKALSLPIIKAVRVKPGFMVEQLSHFNCDAVLLDAYSSTERGGTGDTFDWEIAQRSVELVKRIYLAGGLTPENVADAITTVRPYAVDVCSGIESMPGKKDPEKLKTFIENAKTR